MLLMCIQSEFQFDLKWRISSSHFWDVFGISAEVLTLDIGHLSLQTLVIYLSIYFISSEAERFYFS